MCNISKSVTEFGKNSSKSDKLQTHCKSCRSSRGKTWYAQNTHVQKSRAYPRNKSVLLENRKRIYEYLSQHPCVDCGESRPVVLEFDHVRGVKRMAVASMTRYSWKSISEEISKCEVRCANCHRIKTAIQLGWYKDVV